MKKLFKTLFILTAISATIFTACKKTDTTTEVERNAPTLKVNNGAVSTTVSATVDTVKIAIVASADTDRKIKKLTVTRAIGIETVNVKTATYDVKDLTVTVGDPIKADSTVILYEGTVVTYTITVEDDKGKTALSTFVVNIKTYGTSAQILLGAPSNTTNDYHFLGTGNDFRRYRAGSTGVDLAKDNAASIDFLFFYSSSGAIQNALYSPDYNFGFGNGWYAETLNWTIKNKTVFVIDADMSSSQFDALTGEDFIAQLMNVESTSANWTSGALDRVTSLSISEIIAFKKADGKRGFIKIVNPAASATGVLTMIIKSEL